MLVLLTIRLRRLTEGDLGAILLVLLANLHQNGVVHQLAEVAAVDLILIAERAVLRRVDVVLLMQRVELLLLEPRVHFDLMSGRYDAGLLEETLNLGLGEVRDANRLGLSRLEKLLHRFVRL